MITRMARSENFGKMVGIDLSYNMTAEARSNCGERSFCLQADAESLPLKTGSCDLVVSNLMLQWTDSSALFFGEAKKALKPGGLLLATTLGPATFREIRDAMTSAGHGPRQKNRKRQLYQFLNPEERGGKKGATRRFRSKDRANNLS